MPPDHLAHPDKRSLGRVAVVAAGVEPGYRFEALIGGKGEAAGTGAAAGALYCAEILSGSSGTGMAAGFAGLVFLACLPVAAAAGAIYGTSQAASAHDIEEAKAAAQRAVTALKLQDETLDAALRYGRDLDLGIANPPGAADSVIEISVLEANAFTSGERELRVALGMQARARVLGARDGKVVDTLTLNYRGPPRAMEEWLAADGRAIKAQFRQGAVSIAERAIDEILLIYLPKAVPGEGQAADERVPPYALRAIEPPIRNKVYWSSRMTYGHLERYPLGGLQPAFRWEAWPRGFDIAAGDGPGQAREVRYDFRVYDETGVVYERRALVAPEHGLEQPLEPCRTYRWTVRARFTLNGAPRATEWMGAYDTMGGKVGPWWWRRGSGVPKLAAIPASVEQFYPIVETPSMDGSACPGR